MKTTIKSIILMIALVFSSKIYAQTSDSSSVKKVSEVVSYRVNLFKKKLKLTEAEANQFFPIYDAYISDLTKSKKIFRNKWKKKPIETLSEVEASEYFNDALILQQNEVDLFKNCSDKLKSVIPMTKIIRLASAEREVRLKLIEKANEVKLPKSKKKSTVGANTNVN
jgi:hypothetical protein